MITIEENEEQFLGQAFVGDEDSDSEFVQSSDSEFQADNDNKERIDTADDTENFDGEQEELLRKQKFKNLDEVLNESNYVDLAAQPDLTFLTQVQGKLWQ